MDSVHELICALSEKGELMEEMVAILEEEQRCVVELDLPGLEENSNAKEEAIRRMRSMNDCCGSLLSQAGAEYGLSGGINLSALIARMEEPLLDELEGVQRALISAYGSMERLLTVNRGLVERSVRNMDVSLSYFRKGLGAPDTYSGEGRISETAMEGRLFRREI